MIEKIEEKFEMHKEKFEEKFEKHMHKDFREKDKSEEKPEKHMHKDFREKDKSLKLKLSNSPFNLSRTASARKTDKEMELHAEGDRDSRAEDSSLSGELEDTTRLCMTDDPIKQTPTEILITDAEGRDTPNDSDDESKKRKQMISLAHSIKADLKKKTERHSEDGKERLNRKLAKKLTKDKS